MNWWGNRIWLSLFLIVLTVACLYGQNLTGRYEGAVTRDGSVQLVNFDFYIEAGEQKGTYEIPEHGTYDVPIDEMSVRNDTINIRFYFGNFFCFTGPDKKQITGVSEGWNPKIRLHVKKSTEMEKPYIREEIVFTNNDIKLFGMLYHPKDHFGRNVQYVILIHGSGAQSRYTPYYISLGHTLAEKGFGVLLYDKRGTGMSTGNYEQASFYDLADDALAAVNYLTNRADLVISEIGLLGTSQGGWIAPIAANRSDDVSFLILNVAPSVSVFEQDIHRIKYSMMDEGWQQSSIDSALGYTELYFRYAVSNDPIDLDALVEMGREIEHNTWAYYLNFPVDGDDFAWWRLNNYDPVESLKFLRCRTLVLFGEKDVLVPPAENKAKMNRYLTEAGIDFEIVVVPGAGHDMRTSQGLNGESWNWPHVYWQWRVQPREFMDSIVAFLIRNQDYSSIDTTAFEEVYILGLQGDISKALTFLDTIPAESLTPRQAKVKEEYYSRFRYSDMNIEHRTEDSLVRALIDIYRSYWKSALLDNTAISEHDSSLAYAVVQFLSMHFSSVAGNTEEYLYANFTQYVREFLSERGIVAATGKTGMFYDLLLYAKVTEVTYDVTTPEEDIQVTVVFLEDIISNGWQEYATFGRYTPGGWASNDALFCVKESYDLESEKFNVSYLAHEGKHFADYRKFPNLISADLEYRAKLVELALAQDTVFDLLYFFIRNSNRNRNDPHGLANYCVVRDLSMRVFYEEPVTDIERWKAVPAKIINTEAEYLLKENTKNLMDAGAESVTEFIWYTTL